MWQKYRKEKDLMVGRDVAHSVHTIAWCLERLKISVPFMIFWEKRNLFSTFFFMKTPCACLFAYNWYMVKITAVNNTVPLTLGYTTCG